MFLDELMKRFADMQTQATAKTVVGEPMQINGRTIIPLASVSYGFGMGGGQGPKGEAGKDAPVGGGGGGGARIEPVAFLEITDGALKIQPVVNVNRIAIVALLVAGWAAFWFSRARRSRRASTA
ncbi:MAG TPA: spore germination protein GerW family protein [bacterium]|jgi:uncharacterized spore protein YtfJ|nr:spore germination protein GerW family protein [bacterium]